MKQLDRDTTGAGVKRRIKARHRGADESGNAGRKTRDGDGAARPWATARDGGRG